MDAEYSEAHKASQEAYMDAERHHLGSGRHHSPHHRHHRHHHKHHERSIDEEQPQQSSSAGWDSSFLESGSAFPAPGPATDSWDDDSVGHFDADGWSAEKGDSGVEVDLSGAPVAEESTFHSQRKSVLSDVAEESAMDSVQMVPKLGFEEVPQIGAIGVVAAEMDPELGIPAKDDPFAQREGKTLTWRNVNMKLAQKGDKPDRFLLRNVWGEVPRKQTTAIMGPSGSGKTSLLNILSGRAKSHGKITIDADVRLDNFIVDPTKIDVRKQIAFVAQDDSLQVAATPAESIRFSAKLRLPRSTSNEEIEALTVRMLEELGLTHCANTVVGGSLLKGISGGERKRTSVGVELVVKPSLLFLDEPTSGLDSFSAVQLCNVLKKVANAGASVLFTIHQPSSEIFGAFDHLILLNEGRVMYEGQVADVPEYFAARDYPLPPNYNPADWIMHVAQLQSVKELENAGFFPEDTRDMAEAISGDEVEGKDALGNTIVNRRASTASLKRDGRHVSQWTELFWLLRREGNSMKRDKAFLVVRFVQAAFMSILIGIIFLNVGETDPAVPRNLQSNFGAQLICLMMAVMGTALPTLLIFPQERPVFLREYSTNHYSVLAYFLSRLAIEAFVTAVQMFVAAIITYYLVGFDSGLGWHFLVLYVLAMSSTALAVLMGSAVEDPKMALELMPVLFVPQFLFAGFFVAPELIPVWLRWVQYICPLTYGTRLRLFYEFGDGCGSEKADESCEMLLDSLSVESDDVWWYWVVLVALFFAFRIIGLAILSRKATKFY